jgi:flagella basal body P-ring formation protein FlgA
VVYSRDIKREEVTKMATTTNTNYDWKNVSDDYLNEIIEIQQKVALRHIRYGQMDKLQRAESNIKAAQAERRARLDARLEK